MKRKIKNWIVLVLFVIIFSSCAAAKKKNCPAYSQVGQTIEQVG